MINPKEFTQRDAINSLTGIKSSLGNLRKVVSLTYLLYLANKKKSSIVYAESKDSKIVLKQEYKSFIQQYLNNSDVIEKIDDNPLLTSQIESLYVGLTLMFAFGRISFENTSLSMTKERTGGIRYPKKIDFASNIMTLDLMLNADSEESVKATLVAWLQDKQLDNKIEQRISIFLNICIENNLFKLRRGEDDLYFQTEGIYKSLITGDEVSLESDEIVGPTRILNSMLRENLVPWLNFKKSLVTINSDNDFNVKDYSDIITTSLSIRDIKVDHNAEKASKEYNLAPVSDQPDIIKSYLTAMRTKPFLLLAGISGTGKSRIVKEMAFDSCADLGDLRMDKTTPGNYCLVEVKPNWHDSTELLGYESAIKNTYVLTPFVKFLAKAMKYETGENKVPFFVCLDEMNLAPVEQYFAEFLSVLESRKLVDGKITSEPLVDASHFKAHPDMVYELFDMKKEESTGYGTTEDRSTPYGIENVLFDRLKNEGLRIPSNVVVIGTVNMDETTHQFSRKVIDRAMTIEMNIADGDEPFKSFFESNNDLDYREEAVDANVYLPQFASASNALQALEVNNHEDVVALKAGLPALLGELNQALNNTPFKIAYRVENELVLYFTALRQANEAEKADNLIAQAMDDIMMMKVLPRIEGDDELLTAPLQALNEFASKHSFANSLKKIEEMDKRLKQAHFTSFWP